MIRRWYLKRSARRAAAVLDSECPGWETRVNLARLDLRSYCGCVLGQLYGDYRYVLSGREGSTLQHAAKWESAFCFNAALPYWVDEINKRKAPKLYVPVEWERERV